MKENMLKRIVERRAETIEALGAFTDEHDAAIVRAGEVLRLAVQSQRTVFTCGNGGSAADAQHFAAELVGRYQGEREAFAAVSLTTNTSSLTAISNDYGYDRVFARQVAGLGKEGDVLVAISTSGNSPSILEAAKEAKAKGLQTIALTGHDGGRLAGHCDIALKVPSPTTAKAQELHIHVLHTLCELIEL